MNKFRFHWQSWALAVIVAISAPWLLIHLRAFIGNTAIMLNPMLMLMQIPVIICAAIGARKTRRMPLYTLGLWLVWLIFPNWNMPMLGSFLLIAAVIWGIASIPAMAAFSASVPADEEISV